MVLENLTCNQFAGINKNGIVKFGFCRTSPKIVDFLDDGLINTTRISYDFRAFHALTRICVTLYNYYIVFKYCSYLSNRFGFIRILVIVWLIILYVSNCSTDISISAFSLKTVWVSFIRHSDLLDVTHVQTEIHFSNNEWLAICLRGMFK